MNDVFDRLRLTTTERKTVRDLVHKGWLITPPEGHSKYGCLICHKCAEKFMVDAEDAVKEASYGQGYWRGYWIAIIATSVGFILGEIIFK